MAIQYTPTSLINKIADNNYSYTHTIVKKMTEVDSDIETLQGKTETFRKNIRTLRHYSSGGTSKARLEKQLTDFVKSYNDMISDSDKITDSDVQKQLTKLKELFSDNEKDLKKIGISQTNGKYTFDTDTFEDASDTIINKLLIGHDSFMGTADKIMRKMDENADDAVCSVVEQSITTTSQYDPADLNFVQQTLFAGQALSTIKQYASQSDFSDENIQKTITSNLSAFTASINRIFSTDRQENLNKLIQLLNDEENKSNLYKVGLEFDSENHEMTFDQSIDMSTTDFKTAYTTLFNENASFGNTVSDYCKTAYNTIINPDKLGVSIINTQM